MTEPDQRLAAPSPEAAPRVTLRVLCAGAAQGFLTRLAPQLRDLCDGEVVVRFSAVGALRDALLAGEACDVLIVTDAMVSELAAAGHVVKETRTLLGQVATGLAVRRGDVAPMVRDATSLARTLQASSAIYLPDPMRATAGVHFTGVLRRLGLLDGLASRLHTYPNGATAMRALAGSTGAGHLGCTQTSEIMFTDGVQLAGALPSGFELNTTYAAVLTASAQRPQAVALVSHLGAPSLARLRAECGIELPPDSLGTQ